MEAFQNALGPAASIHNITQAQKVAYELSWAVTRYTMLCDANRAVPRDFDCSRRLLLLGRLPVRIQHLVLLPLATSQLQARALQLAKKATEKPVTLQMELMRQGGNMQLGELRLFPSLQNSWQCSSDPEKTQLDRYEEFCTSEAARSRRISLLSKLPAHQIGRDTMLRFLHDRHTLHDRHDTDFRPNWFQMQDVGRIKEQVHQQFGLSPDQQALFCQGKTRSPGWLQMYDGRTMLDHLVQDGDVLQLCQRLHG